jgi:hypothetical protein
MPKIECWDDLPLGIRQHLIERMRDREISIAELNELRLWVESEPDLPHGEWYKDFGSFKDLRRWIAAQDISSATPESEGKGDLTAIRS